jgi:hypothetical protein
MVVNKSKYTHWRTHWDHLEFLRFSSVPWGYHGMGEQRPAMAAKSGAYRPEQSNNLPDKISWNALLSDCGDD